MTRRRILPDRPLTGIERHQRYRANHPMKDAEYRTANREDLAMAQRARAEKARDKELARVKKWQAENAERHAATQLAIGQRDADRLEQLAGRPRPDVCEACEKPCTSGKRLAFDHCHDKGHFRGWLCKRCNLTLGLVKDDIATLQRLIDYLLSDHMTQPLEIEVLEMGRLA